MILHVVNPPFAQVHPEDTRESHDYSARERRQFGCMEYMLLSFWGVFLLLAGGYLAWRIGVKATKGD